MNIHYNILVFCACFFDQLINVQYFTPSFDKI